MSPFFSTKVPRDMMGVGNNGGGGRFYEGYIGKKVDGVYRRADGKGDKGHVTCRMVTHSTAPQRKHKWR